MEFVDFKDYFTGLKLDKLITNYQEQDVDLQKFKGLCDAEKILPHPCY